MWLRALLRWSLNSGSHDAKTTSMGSLPQGLTTLSEESFPNVPYKLPDNLSVSPLLFPSQILDWRCAGRYFYCETCDSWRAGEHWGIISQVNLPIEPVCSHTGTLQEISLWFFPNVFTLNCCTPSSKEVFLHVVTKNIPLILLSYIMLWGRMSFQWLGKVILISQL